MFFHALYDLFILIWLYNSLIITEIFYLVTFLNIFMYTDFRNYFLLLYLYFWLYIACIVLSPVNGVDLAKDIGFQPDFQCIHFCI